MRPHEASWPDEIRAKEFIRNKTKHDGLLKFLTVLDEGCRECLEIRITGYDLNLEITLSKTMLGKTDSTRQLGFLPNKIYVSCVECRLTQIWPGEITAERLLFIKRGNDDRI